MQTDKEFEDFFRERLNGVEETPPPMAWGKIQEDIKPKKRTYYREMAAVILLFLVATGIFFGVKNLDGNSVRTQDELVSTEPSDQREIAGTIKDKNEKAIGATNEVESGELNSTKSLKSGSENLPVQQEKISAPEIASSGNANVQVKPSAENMPLAIVLADKNKIVKESREQQENKPKNQETTSVQNTRLANTGLALNTGKRNPGALKETKETTSVNTDSNTLITKETTSSVAAPNQVTALESKSETPVKPASESNVIVAQNALTRTDSVALPTIPSLADSVLDLASTKLDKTPKEKQKHGKLAFTVNFTPGIISQRLIENPNDDKYLRFSEANKKENGADLGFDLNVALHHRVSDKTTIDGGFSYTKLHSNINYQITNGKLNVVTSPTGNNSGIVKIGFTYEEEEAQNEFTYGGIRLGLTQELVKGTNRTIFVSGGAGLNMLLSNSGRIYTSALNTTGNAIESTLESNAFHTVNSHLYISGGITKNILPKVSVLVAPAFTYYLNSAMRKQYIFELKPYTFGLNFGLRYQL